MPTNNNQLTNGAGYITSSGTAKTISDTLPISKGGTGKTTGEDAANTLINSLATGTDTPNDADYYISQYAGGGTDITSYHRRPMSALWNYIKSKLATVATSGSYNDLSNKPTIPSVGNGTITIKQAGTTKGTFTTNQSGNTTIELTDSNATYGVATSSALGLVKSGTDITVDSSGNVSVNDDSHNHVISNVDGLQSALDGKAASSHTHDERYYTESEVDTKLNGKANTSHTHSYLPLSGGTLTGDVVLPITKSSVDASLPVAGATMNITDIKNLSNYKTYLGSVSTPSTWYNLISTRHRNGSGDGINYGMYLRSTLTSSGDLTWGKQYAESSWQAERTILDSSNYTSYTVTKTGSGASGTWGINVTGSSASCTGNSATSSKLTSSSYTTISISTSDWSTNSSGGYVCTKTLSSAMAYTNFNIDVVLSTDQSAAKLQIEAWNNVIADGEITQTTSSGRTTAFTFYAFTNKPSVALTVGIQGVS